MISNRPDDLPSHDGTAADAVAVGDFNGDGIPDLAVSGNFLGIFLGTGTGRYQPPTFLPFSSRYLVVGDFDADGNLDIALHPSTILLGDGHGGFQMKGSVGPLFGAQPIVAGDFDGDGILDLATGDVAGNRLEISRGAGDGTFTPLQTLLVGSGIGAFTRLVPHVGDFNRDGIDDIAASNSGDGQIGIVLGVRGAPLSVSYAPSSAAVGGDIRIGDVDGDGILDLAAQAATGFGSEYSINVFIGSGDGTFRAGDTVAAPSMVVFDLADFTGDGKLDIAILATDSFMFTLSTYPGTGSGSFGPPISSRFPGGAGELVDADLNGDGKLDLILPGQGSETVIVAFGTGNGHFEEMPQYSTGVGEMQAVVTTDFNNDGLPDLAVSGRISGGVSILLGRASGGFDPPISASVLVDGGLVAADFNGDGKADVAVSDGFDDLWVLLGTGDGHLGSPIRTQKPYGQAKLVTADFDQDGKPDILMSLGGLTLWPGNGDGTFGAPLSISTDPVQAFSAMDINGDGHVDIVFGTFDPSTSARILRVLLGNGNGTFSAPIDSLLDDTVSAIALADMNQDGKVDAVVTYPFLRAVGVLLGDGIGSFASSINAPTNGSEGSVTLADFNADGVVDVVTTATNFAAVFPGTGGGHLGRPSLFAMPGFALNPVVGDFGAHGKTDIAIGFRSSVYAPPDFVGILENTSCEARRLLPISDVPACVTPGAAFSTQPVLRVVDDGDNPVICDSGNVTASIVPGTGSPGAVLRGGTSVPVVAGTAAFTNLSLAQPGSGYRLQYSHGTAGVFRSRRFTVGDPAAVSITGPSEICVTGAYSATQGFDTYVWSVDGAVVATRGSIVLDTRSLVGRDHTLTVTAIRDGCASFASLPIHVDHADATITAPAAICWLDTTATASVPDAGPGAFYNWTVDNGVILGGNAARNLTFRPGRVGSVTLTVSVTEAGGCSVTNERIIPLDPGVCPPKDLEFADSSWTSTQFTAGNGGGSTASQMTVGGNTFRSVSLDLNAGPGVVLSTQIFNPFTYDPSVSGPLAFVNYAEDAFCISGCSGSGQITGAAILQGGVLYIAESPLETGAQLTARSIHADLLSAASFGRVSVTLTGLYEDTSHPDFSAAGPPMQFGFYRAATSSGAAFSIAAGIDNWSMTLVSGAPNFPDVPYSFWARRFIDELVFAGVTAGCGGGLFCPNDSVTRAQMSVFLLRGKEGASYVPPPASGSTFDDVSASSFAAAYVEELYRRGVTGGCSANPLRYCPNDPVTRQQMAVLLLRTLFGVIYIPPAATGLFSDVPPTSPYARWVEDLYVRGFSAGCGSAPRLFCPSDPVTRAQMAVFIVTVFGLPVPP